MVIKVGNPTETIALGKECDPAENNWDSYERSAILQIVGGIAVSYYGTLMKYISILL